MSVFFAGFSINELSHMICLKLRKKRTGCKAEQIHTMTTFFTQTTTT